MNDIEKILNETDDPPHSPTGTGSGSGNGDSNEATVSDRYTDVSDVSAVSAVSTVSDRFTGDSNGERNGDSNAVPNGLPADASRGSASGAISQSPLVEVTVHTAPDDNTSKGPSVLATELCQGGGAEVNSSTLTAQAKASEPHTQPDGEHPVLTPQSMVCSFCWSTTIVAV